MNSTSLLSDAALCNSDIMNVNKALTINCGLLPGLVELFMSVFTPSVFLLSTLSPASLSMVWEADMFTGLTTHTLIYTRTADNWSK